MVFVFSSSAIRSSGMSMRTYPITLNSSAVVGPATERVGSGPVS